MALPKKRRKVPFVQRAPTSSGEDVPIRVAKMKASHVLWWHSHVQPIIDEDPDRADNGWNWLLYVPFAELAEKKIRPTLATLWETVADCVVIP